MAKKSNQELYKAKKEKNERKGQLKAKRFERKAARKGMTTDELKAKRTELWGSDMANRQAGQKIGSVQEQKMQEGVEDTAKAIKNVVSFETEGPKAGGGYLTSPLTKDRSNMSSNVTDAYMKKKGYM